MEVPLADDRDDRTSHRVTLHGPLKWWFTRLPIIPSSLRSSNVACWKSTIYIYMYNIITYNYIDDIDIDLDNVHWFSRKKTPFVLILQPCLMTSLRVYHQDWSSGGVLQPGVFSHGPGGRCVDSPVATCLGGGFRGFRTGNVERLFQSCRDSS